MQLISNKSNIFSLKNEKAQSHIGEYFSVILFNNKYYLYYSCENKIKLVISNTFNFTNNPQSQIIIQDAPGGCFCIIRDNDCLYMLCGCHLNDDDNNKNLKILNLVWPKKGRFVCKNINEKRIDRKNGMYLLKSFDGIKWEEISKKPVLHCLISSSNIKLGEIAFDTSPYLIKFNNIYYYYGRLNSNLDERCVYLRKSRDLINWGKPIRINIINEPKNNLKKNYYNFVVFEYQNKLYALTPYFEACGTINRKCSNGCTLLLNSTDGINWIIINKLKPHKDKYKDRVNDVIQKDNKINIFFRENILMKNQNFITYELKL